MESGITRKTNLTEHVIQFVRYLRGKGFTVGAREEMEILEVLAQGMSHSFEAQKAIYKSILVKNRKQFVQFGELHDDYWEQVSRAEDGKVKEVEKEVQKPSKGQVSSDLQVLKDWLYNGRESGEHEVAAHSAIEAISKKDFSAFHTEERKELQDLIKLISTRMANRASRRYRKSKAKKSLDLKATIRKSLRKGNQIDAFEYKEKKIRKTNLILLCDVSRSMELYSQFLIEFMYGFQQINFRIKTFVFSTRLISLSRTLADGDFEKVLHNLSEQVPYWSGGTRIGESLQEFRQNYGSRLLNQKSIVLILSDGWDTGDTSILEESMIYLSKKSEKIIWLNPLAGNPDYKVETQAMKAALPYIDVFTSAHNLESLQGVAGHFSKRKFKLI